MRACEGHRFVHAARASELKSKLHCKEWLFLDTRSTCSELGSREDEERDVHIHIILHKNKLSYISALYAHVVQLHSFPRGSSMFAHELASYVVFLT